MKKLKLMAVAAGMLLAGAASHAAIPYTPPEFVESEWTEYGIGSYEPGVLDYFGGEYQGIVPCQMYKNVKNENEIWVEPVISEELQAELNANENGLPPVGAFILHIDNPEKVWVSPIWTIHPMIFCFYQAVPEVMGLQGAEVNYAKKEGLKITFPASCFILTTLPTGTPASNNNGTFAINLPDPAGVANVEMEQNGEAEYYDMTGMKVDKPQSGKIYIVKSGNKAKKIMF